MRFFDSSPTIHASAPRASPWSRTQTTRSWSVRRATGKPRSK